MHFKSTLYVVAEQVNPNNPPAVNPSPLQDKDHYANRQGMLLDGKACDACRFDEAFSSMV